MNNDIRVYTEKVMKRVAPSFGVASTLRLTKKEIVEKKLYPQLAQASFVCANYLQ